jgi:hypothetical protein
LDERNIEAFSMYALVSGQVRVSGMGDVIGLDHRAVLDVIRLYVEPENVKAMFERVLECFHIERELSQ